MTATADDAVRSATIQPHDAWNAILRGFSFSGIQPRFCRLLFWVAVVVSMCLVAQPPPGIRLVVIVIFVIAWLIVWSVMRLNSLVMNAHPRFLWALMAIASLTIVGVKVFTRGADLFYNELHCDRRDHTSTVCGDVLVTVIFFSPIAMATSVACLVHILISNPATVDYYARAWDLVGHRRKIVCFGIPAIIGLTEYVFQMQQQHTRGTLTIVTFVAVACSHLCVSLSLLSFVHKSWIALPGILLSIGVHTVAFGAVAVSSKYLWPWMFDTTTPPDKADAFICTLGVVSLCCIPTLAILSILVLGVWNKINAILRGAQQ